VALRLTLNCACAGNNSVEKEGTMTLCVELSNELMESGGDSCCEEVIRGEEEYAGGS
jgi:hypothetical protein